MARRVLAIGGAALAAAFATLVLAGCPAPRTEITGGDGGAATNGSTGAAGAARRTRPTDPVTIGLDVLRARGHETLAGARVGFLVSQPLLAEAPNVVETVAALPGAQVVFVALAPPHAGPAPTLPEGVEARTLVVNTPHIGDPAWDAIDVLCVDLSLTGLRNDAALTLLAVAMEDAYLKEKKVVVLDRPNPLGGLAVEGPVQDPRLYGAPTSFYPLPLRHGMTVGEIAQLYNDFLGIGAELDIIAMEGYSRTMDWERTAMPWSPLQPGLDTREELLRFGALAPIRPLGLEMALDFAVAGAPGIDPAAMAAAATKASATMQSAESYRWEPTTFTPEEGPYAGKPCGGVALRIVDARNFSPVEAALSALVALQAVRGRDLKLDGAYPFIGSQAVLDAIAGRKTPESIAALYENDIRGFQLERLRALIYKR